MIKLTNHHKRHTPQQKEMTLYLQECSELPPSVDLVHTAMLAKDATSVSSSTHSFIDDTEDKYLPELQSFKAVLKLNNDIHFTSQRAINIQIKTLINNHNTIVLGQEPRKNELKIPVKQVLKTKQTATGRLEKRNACLATRGNMKKLKIK